MFFTKNPLKNQTITTTSKQKPKSLQNPLYFLITSFGNKKITLSFHVCSHSDTWLKLKTQMRSIRAQPWKCHFVFPGLFCTWCLKHTKQGLPYQSRLLIHLSSKYLWDNLSEEGMSCFLQTVAELYSEVQVLIQKLIQCSHYINMSNLLMAAKFRPNSSIT